VADVAQLVESQIVILVVAGSSPVVRPTHHINPGPSRILKNHPQVVFHLLG